MENRLRNAKGDVNKYSRKHDVSKFVHIFYRRLLKPCFSGQRNGRKIMHENE